MIINKDKKIEIQYKNIYDLSKKQIGIPMFQRFYAWRDKEIKQLLEDIEKLINNKGQLYLLDFIYYVENGRIMLADGQQRIVTINLLIKAINDHIENNELGIKKIEMFNITYDILENDDRYKKMLVGFPIMPFKKVYIELLEFVKSKNINDLKKIIDIVKKRIYVYMKKCDNVDDAFQIFQQINTGGKPLTKDEIIKTALDQYSTVYEIELDTSKIKEIRQSIISFYKYKEDNYNANFDNMQIMSFMKKYITGSKEQFSDFVKYIAGLKLNEDNPLAYVIEYINRPILKDVLNMLSIKEINIAKNKEYQNKIILPLCLASITLSLNGGSPPIFKYLVNDIIRMIKEDKKADDISFFIANYINEKSSAFKITFDSFVEKIDSEWCNQNMKKAILIMEVTYRNESGAVFIDKINLEHIYPQNPNKSWYTKGWPTDSTKSKKITNNIGNQILLCESINKKIQNEYITDKIDEYKKIMEKDRVLQTKMNTFDFEQFVENRDEYIKERQIKIAKIIKDDMPFGSVLIINN